MRTAAAFMAAAILASCAIRRHASDPSPVSFTPTEASPLLVDQSTVPVSVVTSVPVATIWACELRHVSI